MAAAGPRGWLGIWREQPAAVPHTAALQGRLNVHSLRGGGVQGPEPGLEKNVSSSTTPPPLQTPAESDRLGQSSQFWALHRPWYSGLRSQGHWEGDKGEQSSWETRAAAILPGQTPGKNRKEARVGSIWRPSQKTRTEKGRTEKASLPYSNLRSGQWQISGPAPRATAWWERTRVASGEPVPWISCTCQQAREVRS